ncbi:ABC transporter [Lasiosphaeria hispida]|uniref:ABC transporter n=1 Tax=Lasiosphaeria hispida TaxID=260671 RepID=A0AAJ0HGZ1_9PEZI|nr:ABC transporter [Lasiosphaeria hispida]
MGEKEKKVERMQQDAFFLAAVATLAVSALAAIPAIVASVARLQNAKPANSKYEDEDGEATSETMAEFSTKYQRAHVLVWAAVGLGSQIAFSVILDASQSSPVPPEHFSLQNWLLTAAWGLLGVQAIAIAASRDSVSAYYQGLRLAGSSLIIGSVLLARLNVAQTWYDAAGRTGLILCVVSSVAAAGLVLASLLLPRRPDVFSKGRIVDRMFTTSAWSRLTFVWATPLMLLATEKGDLDLVDLPRPSHYLRPDYQSAEWKTRKNKDSFFKSMMRIYGWGVVKQWMTAALNSSVSYLPWWITLRLLESLESRRPGETAGSRIWLFLVWLGLVKIANSLIESWLFWSQINDLYVPIRSHLAAIVFEKAMRRKNVKGANKTSGDDKGVAEQGKDDDDKSKDEEGASDDTTGQKSRQAVINLVGIDAKRVSDFSLYMFLFPTSIIQLIISVWFLISLLGWLPLVLGVLSVAATLPINFLFSKWTLLADQKLMKIRDEKLELVSEALNGIRQVKFSALESGWEKRILKVREKELATIWQLFRYNLVVDSCWNIIPSALALTALGSYAWIHGGLTASVAFVSIGILGTLDFAIAALPGMIRYGIDAWVSLKRIEKFLDGPEIQSIRTFSSERPDVAFKDASLSWPVDSEEDKADESNQFILRNVNLSFPPGELSVICGKTGSGKSLLLAAILGEAELLSGSIHVPQPPSIDERQDHKANPGNWVLPSSIAYVGQQPWIENATVRDNVLFGMPFDEERYERTLAACALKKDIGTLSDGDKTELGINGVNLSGGQKWRVTVARAIYSRAGILILDDIFSAVDAHVSRHILEQCLGGSICKGRTIIIVTHHVGLVEKHARFIVELADGGVQYSGLTEQLREERILDEIKSFESPVLKGSVVSSDTEVEPDGGLLKKQTSKVPAKFVEDETRQKGAVKARIYKIYLERSGGFLYWAFLLFIFLTYQASQLAQPWVIRLWTGRVEQSDLPALFQQTLAPSTHYHHYQLGNQSSDDQQAQSIKFWLSVYAGTCLISVIFGIARYGFTFIAGYWASRAMFERILFSVLRAPLRWTDTVPVGRILNRLTADFNSIDSDLVQMGEWFLANWLQVIGICAASLFVSPFIAPIAALCLGVCIWLAKVYLTAARPAKRLDSTLKSPIFDLFGSALTGLTTIRAFDRAGPYIQAMHTKVEEYSMGSLTLYLFNRWLAWNMSLAGIAFTVVVTIFVLARPGLDAALAGFVLSFTLQFSHAVLMSVRASSMLELEMNAVERVIEYSEIETESLGGEKPPAAWPTQGRLEVNDLIVGYAPHLPPVLKSLSFQINPAERIGVVGRTGAGKSSLTLALFRFIEPRSGSIYIDGLDISKINLSDLRSRLAIIPQDPVLFSGTIRSNLDPFNNYTDAELSDSLRRVHLVADSEPDSNSAAPVIEASSSSSEDTATNTPTSNDGPRNVNVFLDLSSPISEGGQNLSQGQRQLLCLARAIVSRPKIMVLDEATSAVDMTTDALIQCSIREEFGGSTLLVIAHRLSTIADFDRILVLSDGEVVEFGTPRELWEDDDGVFRSMCNESGEKDKLRVTILGEGASGGE